MIEWFLSFLPYSEGAILTGIFQQFNIGFGPFRRLSYRKNSVNPPRVLDGYISRYSGGASSIWINNDCV